MEFHETDALHAAIRRVDLAGIQQIIAQYTDPATRKIAINTPDQKGNTPLYLALLPPARPLTRKVVALLLKAGANPNLPSRRRFPIFNVLHSAELLNLLLQYDTDPNVQDSNGVTALYTSSEYKNLKQISLLLPYADPRLRTKWDKTVFDEAINNAFFDNDIEENSISILQYLLSYPNITLKDEQLRPKQLLDKVLFSMWDYIIYTNDSAAERKENIQLTLSKIIKALLLRNINLHQKHLYYSEDEVEVLGCIQALYEKVNNDYNSNQYRATHDSTHTMLQNESLFKDFMQKEIYPFIRKQIGKVEELIKSAQASYQYFDPITNLVIRACALPIQKEAFFKFSKHFNTLKRLDELKRMLILFLKAAHPFPIEIRLSIVEYAVDILNFSAAYALRQPTRNTITEEDNIMVGNQGAVIEDERQDFATDNRFSR